jgi:hypothetical protein
MSIERLGYPHLQGALNKNIEDMSLRCNVLRLEAQNIMSVKGLELSTNGLKVRKTVFTQIQLKACFFARIR